MKKYVADLFTRIFSWSQAHLDLLIILSALLVSSTPLFKPSMYLIHDFTHGARISEMSLALKDGHFPVRWSKNFGFGYGMPLFQFYGPLPFYLGSLIFFLLGDILFSVKFLFFLSSFFTFLGGYLLGKSIFRSRWSGLITSIAVGLAPYRFLNLYIRGALNELWGMMAIIWILCALRLVVDRVKNSWLLLSVSMIVLFLSHNLSSLIFAPFFLISLAIFLQLRRSQKKPNKHFYLQVTKEVGVATVLAVGVSAFYLFPAYLEKDFTQYQSYVLADYFNFRTHFVYIKQLLRPNWGFGGSILGPNDPISFFLGFGQLFGLLIAIISWTLLTIKKEFSHTKKFLLFLFPFGLSSIMSTHYGQFIWEMLPLLEIVQFPWRFLSLATIFLALILGWVGLVTGNGKKGVVIKTLMISACLLNLIFVRPEGYLLDATEVYRDDSSLTKDEISQYLPDYIPQQLKTRDHPGSLLTVEEQFLGDFQVVADKTHFKQIEIQTTSPSKIILNIADYPGWRVYLNNSLHQHSTAHNGEISVKVPKGKNNLIIKFQSTTIRRASDLISFLSAGVLLFLLLRMFHKSKNANRC